MVKKMIFCLFALTLCGCAGITGNYGQECHYQVRGVALWFQPGYGNKFDQERTVALKSRSDLIFPDKERLYRYLESVTCDAP